MTDRTNTNNRGGKRPGAGRRPAQKQPRNVKKFVKLTADEAEYISEVGSGELWRLLQASKEYKEWLKARQATTTDSAQPG